MTYSTGLHLMTAYPHEDFRGSFMESFNKRDFKNLTGIDADFVQDNHSISKRGVIRGLHYQIKNPQGKLVRVTKGSIYDVVVDMRRSSAGFGHWHGVMLSEENRNQFWIPPGFAHGFKVLSEVAEVQYKVTDYQYKEHERCLLWNDPKVGIDWHLISDGDVSLSERDRSGTPFSDSETFE
jgi:dTDP-4-dehydrorhamnose 3,5-epimerase